MNVDDATEFRAQLSFRSIVVQGKAFATLVKLLNEADPNSKNTVSSRIPRIFSYMIGFIVI